MKIMNLKIKPEFRYMSKGLGDISESILEAQELHGKIDKIRIDGKITHLPRYIKRKVKHKTLSFGLDLKQPTDLIEYERRRILEKEENMQALQIKLQEEDAEIMHLNMRGDIYSRKSQIKKQKKDNYEINTQIRQYGKKVKKLL